MSTNASTSTPAEQTGGKTHPGAYRQPNGSNPEQNVEPLVLPPKTNALKFQEYVNRISSIIGQNNVTIISEKGQLDGYDYFNPSKASDMFYLCDNDYFVCSAVCAPRGVEDVQALMKLSNEFEIPVWPFSIGRNLGYGGSAPRVQGSVGLGT